MPDPKKLVITPEMLAFSIVGPQRDVMIDLMLPPFEAKLVGIDLAIRMNATAARQFAAALVQKADLAEAEGLAGPRH